MKEQYQNKLEKGKSSKYLHIKRFTHNRKIDIERAAVKAMKNWIKVIKEIKKKSEMLLQDDIRFFFAG